MDYLPTLGSLGLSMEHLSLSISICVGKPQAIHVMMKYLVISLGKQTNIMEIQGYPPLCHPPKK